ncbi:MAG TPA: radical SAM protein [Myxococcales bacterium]|nr:radical SAM protein [Myxococcales bacterium]
MKLSPAELRARAVEARRHYARCDLCAHDCRVDRTHGPAGVCHEDDGLWLAGAGVHHGEEPSLVPSGLVLIGGCNLACAYCETFEFSLQRRGLRRTSPEELAALLLDLASRGARNANFATPTHMLPALLEGLAIAAEHGFDLPVVWNCGGYESLPALQLLENIVNIYLPDAKYGDDAVAFELSGCRGYTAAVRESLAEMRRQTPEVIVRHLVLPGLPADGVMRLIAGVATDLTVNVMSQYRPVHQARRFPVIARAASAAEVHQAAAAAHAAGLRRVLVDGKPHQPR